MKITKYTIIEIQCTQLIPLDYKYHMRIERIIYAARCNYIWENGNAEWITNNK